MPVFRIKISNFEPDLKGEPFRIQYIVGKNKAFAIISRLAKSVGNLFGITSTIIICDRRTVW